MRKTMIFILMIISTVTNADPWSSWTKITYIYPHTEGLNIVTEYKNPALSSCEGGGRYFLPKTHANYQVLASTLISAFMGGKEIWFNIDGEAITDPICAPSLNRLMVR